MSLSEQETEKMADLAVDLRGLAADHNYHDSEAGDAMLKAATTIESMRAMIFNMSGLADFCPDEMPKFSKEDVLDLKYAAEELRRTGHVAVPDGLLDIGFRISIALRKKSEPETQPKEERARFDAIFDFTEFQYNARKFGTEAAVFEFWKKLTDEEYGK